MSGAATGVLVEQARALEESQRLPAELRAQFARELRSGLDRARVELAGAAAVADRSAFVPAAEALDRAGSELDAGQLTEAARATEEAEASAKRAVASLVAHREGQAGGAERTAPPMEWTRDIALNIGAGKQPQSTDPKRDRLRALLKDPEVAKRVASESKRSSVEGALYEEFINVEIPERLRTGEAAGILPGRDTSKLTFVPGHQVTDREGHGYSDGLVLDKAELERAAKAAVEQQKKEPAAPKAVKATSRTPAATIELPAFVEGKAGGAGVKDLWSTPLDEQRDYDSDQQRAAERAHYKQVVGEEKLEREAAKAVGKDVEPGKVIKTEHGGQIQKTYERVDIAEGRYADVYIKGLVVDGKLQEGVDGRGLLVRLKVSRLNTTAIIATPQELTQRGKGRDVPVKVSDAIEKLKSYGLENVTHLESETSQQAVRDVANEYRAANPPPPKDVPRPKVQAPPKPHAAAPEPKANSQAPRTAEKGEEAGPAAGGEGLFKGSIEGPIPVVNPKPSASKKAPPATKDPAGAKQPSQTERPTNEAIESQLRRERTEPWGRPSSGPIQHEPGAKAQFRGAAAEAVAYTIGEVMHWLNEWSLESSITREFEAKQEEIESYRREHPYDGVMVVITIERWDPAWRPSDAPTTRDLLSLSLRKGGRTEEDALAQHYRGPSISAGADEVHRLDEERRIWIKPLKAVAPHDWIGGVYRSEDPTRALDLHFTSEGMLQLDAWHVDRGSAFTVEGVSLHVSLPTRPDAPIDARIDASFTNPVTREHWKSVFTLDAEGRLVEQLTNTEGLRRVYVWSRRAQ
jgi:hypothetical protein